jgi:hypothetical protein
VDRRLDRGFGVAGVALGAGVIMCDGVRRRPKIRSKKDSFRSPATGVGVGLRWAKGTRRVCRGGVARACGVAGSGAFAPRLRGVVFGSGFGSAAAGAAVVVSTFGETGASGGVASVAAGSTGGGGASCAERGAAHTPKSASRARGTLFMGSQIGTGRVRCSQSSVECKQRLRAYWEVAEVQKSWDTSGE